MKITTWENVNSTVNNIMATENSYTVSCTAGLPTIDRFSPSGISMAGARLHFPADFVKTLLDNKHREVAQDILRVRTDDYFSKNNTKLLVREFLGEVYGLLTDKYSIFDDNEVCDLLSTSDYLMNAGEVWSDITPDHFHVRFISSHKLYVQGDESPLSMAIFVDNSMVGKSSLKIRFGIYRFACTNGLITGLKEFRILREVHHGAKEWSKILCEALKDIDKYEQMMIDMVENMIATKSSIYGMTEEDAVRYIKDKLNIGKKQSQVIYNSYLEYGGESRWDLANAITDVAHEYEFETRLHYEENALRVA